MVSLGRWLTRHARCGLMRSARKPNDKAAELPPIGDEVAAIRERYHRRSSLAGRYSMLDPSIYMAEQEKERAIIRWIAESQLAPLAEKRLLEIGCGTGGNLLEFLRLGFA